MGNWAEIVPDVLILIVNRVDSFEDFVAFGGVCTSWRSVAVKQNFNTSSPQLPWLMLSEKEEEEEEEEEGINNNMREFFSLSKGMIHKVPLPEARGKRCFETLGWLVTITKDGEMGLLHPFSRLQIGLPHQTTFKYFHQHPMDLVDFVFKAVLSASPSLTPNYVLMVIHGAAKHLGFWRPGGDNSWTVIETRDSPYEDVIYYKGQFYALNNQGSIFVWDVGGPNPTVARKVGGIKSELLRCMQPYMVESGGELLVVARCVIHPGDDTDPTYETTSFKVYEVDLSKEARWQEINNLGGRALFLGHSASISVDASRFFPAIKPNCIYYTDDYMDMYTYPVDNNPGGGKDMGVYNLEDGSKEPLNYKGQSLSYTCPPAWVLPSF
ncbi:unnamed protein product [Camellia sinensis]